MQAKRDLENRKDIVIAEIEEGAFEKAAQLARQYIGNVKQRVEKIRQMTPRSPERVN